MSDTLLGHQLHGEGGEVVLLLNGGMMSHGAWAPVVARLVEDYRVLGCDFRGQLLSPGPGHPRLEDHVDDVVALLDALDLDAVHVLGTSFGGEVGLLLAAHHPARVRTLAAVTAVDRTPSGLAENARELRTLARRAADGDAAPFHDALLRDVYSPEYREAHAEELSSRRGLAIPAAWYEGLLGLLESIEAFDLSACLGKIRCPTLVVHAAQDGVMPVARVKALAEAIHGAEFQLHTNSGHALVAEDPIWLVGVYRHFLARRGKPADAAQAAS